MVAQDVRRRTVRSVAVVAAVVLGAGGCGSADAARAPQERKVFPFDGDVLTVDSGDSDVVLVPADVEDVEVTRRVDGWVVLGSGPEARWRMEGGTLTLDVVCDAVVQNCEAIHEVRVPRGVGVSLRGDSGDVSASGFASALTVRTDNGDVTVSGARGPLDLATDNGTLRVDGATSAKVAARSENGDIRLGLRGAPAKVEGRSSNGTVVVEVPAAAGPYAVDAGSDNGTVTTDVPREEGSPRSITAHSENGDVTVRTAN
ncbi:MULTISPECIES: DUF4097 family beta strand repeat-containing protein [Streptomyces]|uniref:DUF4097 family beta strand repeat-containing protein n=1 Tax=Streptomyces TaxID=1883 RepID=UPI0004CCF63C|nr:MULTISPECIES: DUF4097 family beta strand repeat-containing protein [Streptomyces]UQS28370.1 DUF4097 family beta strand repeat protein [Streptomyces fradiae]